MNITVVTQAVPTRGFDQEAGAVDVGVGQTDRQLPVGSGEDVGNIDGEAHSTPHWVNRPQ